MEGNNEENKGSEFWDKTKIVAASAGITLLHGAAWGAGIAAGIVGVTWAAGKLGMIPDVPSEA